MAQVVVTEEYLSDIAQALRVKLGTSETFKPSQMANGVRRISGGGSTLIEKTITANGTYNASSDNANGYSKVVANVPNTYSANDEGKVVDSGALVTQSSLSITQNGTYDTTLNNEVVVSVSGGGGGGSVVLSGTTTPTSAQGNDEDLYVKYEAKSVPPYDHVYKIDSIYRKVSGAWIAYIEPIPPTIGCHIWTHSKGMNDASIWVQNGFWNEDDNQFVPTEEAFSVLYTTVQSGTYNCNDIATLSYPSNWKVYATDTITDGTNTYTSGNLVKTWPFNTSVDFYIWKSST